METGQSRSWVPPPKDKSPFSGIIRSAMLFPAMSRATAVSVLERGVVTAVAGRNTTADRQHHSSQQQPPHRSQQRAVSHRSAGSVLSSEMAAKLVSCHRVILVMSSCHCARALHARLSQKNIFTRILVSSDIVETRAKHSFGGGWPPLLYRGWWSV